MLPSFLASFPPSAVHHRSYPSPSFLLTLSPPSPQFQFRIASCTPLPVANFRGVRRSVRCAVPLVCAAHVIAFAAHIRRGRASVSSPGWTVPCERAGACRYVVEGDDRRGRTSFLLSSSFILFRYRFADADRTPRTSIHPASRYLQYILLALPLIHPPLSSLSFPLPPFFLFPPSCPSSSSFHTARTLTSPARRKPPPSKGAHAAPASSTPSSAACGRRSTASGGARVARLRALGARVPGTMWIGRGRGRLGWVGGFFCLGYGAGAGAGGGWV